MPDYRRFIAYFYEYIDGKRQRNAGFVKAERRNEVWRVTLQLKAVHWPGTSMKIYGYYQETDRYKSIFLGSGYPQGDSMIQQLHLSTQVIKDSGKGFENLNGMWIPCGENRCFVSNWDEEAVDVGQLKEAGVGIRQPKKAEAGNGQLKKAGAGIGQQEEGAEAEQHPETPAVIEAAECSGENEKREEDDIAEVSECEGSDGEAAGSGMTEQEAVENEREEHRITENETVERKNAEVEMAEYRIPESEIEEQEAMASEAAEQKRNRFPINPAWSALQSRCQRLPVFEHEGWECIRICPRDVMWLRQQRWPVGRNSFLMRGFCQYHHILLGRDSNDRMILGVPGRENEQEQQMAMVFGFPEFRSAGMTAGRSGGREGGYPEEFGYWCREL